MDPVETDGLRALMPEALGVIDVLARALHVKDARLEATLDAIVANAAATHPGAKDAGLILLISGKLVPKATTGRPPQLLDRKQQETGDGPCVEAALKQTLIRIDDTGADNRWPDFSAEAQACGVRSLLCAPLWIDERRLGTLTLYAVQPEAFSEHDEKIIKTFATLAAIALAEVQRIDQLQTSIASRDLIGQAKGILMERYKIDADAAFSILSRTSQAEQTKLHEIARHLVETGELPGTPGQNHGRK